MFDGLNKQMTILGFLTKRFGSSWVILTISLGIRCTSFRATNIRISIHVVWTCENDIILILIYQYWNDRLNKRLHYYHHFAIHEMAIIIKFKLKSKSESLRCQFIKLNLLILSSVDHLDWFGQAKSAACYAQKEHLQLIFIQTNYLKQPIKPDKTIHSTWFAISFNRFHQLIFNVFIKRHSSTYVFNIILTIKSKAKSQSFRRRKLTWSSCQQSLCHLRECLTCLWLQDILKSFLLWPL